MRHRNLNASPDYIDDLCDSMEKWAEKENSWIVPQFLKFRGLSFRYFKGFCLQYPKVDAYFEVLKATLNTRWLEFGLNNDVLPPHKGKMLLRYLRIYDSHVLDMEDEVRAQRVELEEKIFRQQYEADNYGSEQLEEPYREGYEQCDNQRRSEEEAE